MHKTDNNTIEILMFQTAIYKPKTTLSAIYVEYAKCLFCNKPQTNHDHTTARQIEDLLHMNLFSVNPSESKEKAYNQLAWLKMQTLGNKNKSSNYQQAMQIYDQGY